MGHFSAWAGTLSLDGDRDSGGGAHHREYADPGAQRLARSRQRAGRADEFVIRSVTWKAAQAGIITGVLLAMARISGETAPLLFTALNNQFLIDQFQCADGVLPA